MHVIAYSGLSMYPPRRPWSPDPYDPLPSITHVHHSRQDPSDVSVEALDLAAEPVSPLPTVPSSSRYHSRRHFSLPPPSDTTFARPVQSVDSEIDISRFPVWSRDWYTSTKSIPRLNSPPDIYTPLPVSQFNFSANPSPFDLAYKHKEGPSVYEHLSSPFAHDASRDILPWSSDPSNNGTPLDASVKEERIRMLEHEFGPQNKSKSHSNIQDGLDENGNPVIGSVDEKGKLVTQGPKKRIALRVLQIFLTLAAGVPSIYAALVSPCQAIQGTSHSPYLPGNQAYRNPSAIRQAACVCFVHPLRHHTPSTSLLLSIQTLLLSRKTPQKLP